MHGCIEQSADRVEGLAEVLTDEYLAGLFERPPWPHQIYGVRQAILRVANGSNSICLSSPTGGGKSAMICALINYYTERRWSVALYTNRIMLTEQTIGVLERHGIDFGVRAASFKERKAGGRLVQICSMQTEQARIRRKVGNVFPAKLVIVDECHLQSKGKSEDIINGHLAQGSVAIGVTATPIGVSHVYPELIIAGRNSQLRECGALVWADMYSPWEMDIRDLKVEENGEYNYEQVKKKYTQTLYGLVVKSMRDFNPELKPTLLFAPGVAESAEFARVFTENGIKSAHIDGEDVWCDGKFYSSDANARSEVMDRFRDGDIRIICNRYVLREGIDIPYAAHMILATPIGSVRSYIQIVGRILRRSPETPDYVTIVDHGGSFWSHGSPNEDRDWSEIYDLPERTCSILRKERIRERVEREPDACPECGLVFIPTTSHRCPQCGHEMKKKFRTVLQTNSELVRVTGDAIRPRFVKQKPDTQKIWTKLYHGCANSKKKRGVSFIQAEALFLREHGYYPPRTLNFMPTRDIDWLRQIRDVPMGRLRRDDR